jgi:hypothetical protein
MALTQLTGTLLFFHSYHKTNIHISVIRFIFEKLYNHFKSLIALFMKLIFYAEGMGNSFMCIFFPAQQDCKIQCTGVRDCTPPLYPFTDDNVGKNNGPEDT